ncbi:MAG: DUF4912 domain-containing protein [Pirellulales bacterium]|nr:DUF4912 domain-containing protein [Pirellulales bacterium]
MTAATLKTQTLKDLTRLAQRAGVSGWNQMRKDELVKAILRSTAKEKPANGTHTKKPAISKRTNSHPSTAGGRVPSTGRINRGLVSGSTVNGASVGRAASVKSSRSVAATTKVVQKLQNEQKKQKILTKIEQAKTKQWDYKNLASSPSTSPSEPKSSPATKNSTVGKNGHHKNGFAKNDHSTTKAPPAKSTTDKAVVAALPPTTPSVAKLAIHDQRLPATPAKDRLIVMVRGPFWLHASWELTPAGVQRAQAALAQDWHTVRPILRVITLSTSNSSTSSERVSRDIPIHGGVKNWYIDVNDPPQTYRLEIGYLTSKGKFFCLARSNTVSTPPAQQGDSLDTHWGDISENCEKIYALSGGYSENGAGDLREVFEERLRRPMNSRTPHTETLVPRDREFRLQVEAEIVVHGTAAPGATITMQGEPITVHSDGSFNVRMDFPNRRQVIPIVANSKDSVQQRTVVLAVERNTKTMEPLQRENVQE